MLAYIYHTWILWVICSCGVVGMCRMAPTRGFSLRIDQALDEELVPWLGMEWPTCCLEIFGWMLVDDIFGNIWMNGYLTWLCYIIFKYHINYPYFSNEQIHHQFFLGWWLLWEVLMLLGIIIIDNWQPCLRVTGGKSSHKNVDDDTLKQNL